VPFSIYLTIADAVLIAIFCREFSARRISVVAAALLCVAFAILYARAARTTLYFMQHDSARARLARGALLFSRVIDSTPVFREIVYPPDPTLPVRLAAALDDFKLLRPPLVRSAIVSPPPRAAGNVAGSFEREFAGWAALVDENRPADCVLLAYETPAHEWIGFAIADTLLPRYDIVKRFRKDELLWCGWRATVQTNVVPRGAKISAWAVRADGPSVYKLDGEFSAEMSR
jgi:hypothetical protein